MSLGMFLIGALIFSIYAAMALIITIFGKDENEKEYHDLYKKDVDLIDYDGMGNQGRMPKPKNIRRKKLIKRPSLALENQK